MVVCYRGSVLGRQELDGEMIEDLPTRCGTAIRSAAIAAASPGAWWRRTSPVTGRKADACGSWWRREWGGRDPGGLDDIGCAPAQLGTAGSAGVWRFEADCIAAEVNQGAIVKARWRSGCRSAGGAACGNARKWLRAELVAAPMAGAGGAHAEG